MFQTSDELKELRPRITVIGVGGAGNNAVATMAEKSLRGVELVAANTDAQALRTSIAPRTLQLGRGATAGLGAGSCAATGRAAAEESRADIARFLESSHMCFIAAGMGGGTGTGAAPVFAEIARGLGILTVAVVTKPFAFEGARRNRLAEKGIEELAGQVDSLIVVPNQNLFRIIGPSTTLKSAFALADEILYQGVRSISDLMVVPGLINLDFADVRSILVNTGRAKIGTGEASGDDRAQRAALQALTDPLLDDEIGGAEGLLVSISGGDDMLLCEVDEAAHQITTLVHSDADIIWGSNHDPSLEGRLRVSIVAAGIGKRKMARDERTDAKLEAPAICAAAVEPLAPARAGNPAETPILATRPAIGPDDQQSKGYDGPDEEDLLLSIALPVNLPFLPREAIDESTDVAAAPRSRSLFERMASAARGAAANQSSTFASDAPVPRRLVIHDQRAA